MSEGQPATNEAKVIKRYSNRKLYDTVESRYVTLDEIADEVKFLINGWFYNHILVADFDYVPSVKAAATPTPTS